MAAPVYISSDSNATEVVTDKDATQEVVLVSPSYPNSKPVRLMTRVRPGVLLIKIVNLNEIVNGETIP